MGTGVLSTGDKILYIMNMEISRLRHMESLKRLICFHWESAWDFVRDLWYDMDPAGHRTDYASSYLWHVYGDVEEVAARWIKTI